MGRDRGRYITGSQGCRKPEDRPTISTDSAARKEEKDTKESRVLNTFLNLFTYPHRGQRTAKRAEKFL